MPDDGIISVRSHFSANETIERLLAAIAEKNLTVFARLDHAAGAASVGLPLRTTELVIFGSPKGGTPLMQDQQLAGIDLPLKALIWEDAERKAWLSYNDPDVDRPETLAWFSQQFGSDSNGGSAPPNCARGHGHLVVSSESYSRGGVATETHAAIICIWPSCVHGSSQFMVEMLAPTSGTVTGDGEIGAALCLGNRAAPIFTPSSVSPKLKFGHYCATQH